MNPKEAEILRDRHGGQFSRARAPAPESLIGQVFGRLTVQSEAEKQGRRRQWNCLCSCGSTCVAQSDRLKSGNTKSCGCSRKAPKPWKQTHNMTKTPTWRSWSSMKERCCNPNNHQFSNYGGRGITVCDAWINSFETFLADMGIRPADTSIDRIDPNSNYEPGNCRWATTLEQSRNKRTSHFAEAFGEIKTVSEWAIDPRNTVAGDTLKGRIRKGWPLEVAMTTPACQGKGSRHLIRSILKAAPKETSHVL